MNMASDSDRIATKIKNFVGQCLAILVISLAAAACVADEGWQVHSIEFQSTPASEIAVGDVNRDGSVDVVATYAVDGAPAAIHVYLNPGNGNTESNWPQVRLPLEGMPQALLLTDIDGDGSDEIIIGQSGNDVPGLSIAKAPKASEELLATDKWIREPIEVDAWKHVPTQLATAELNGKPGRELVVATESGTGRLGWLERATAGSEESGWKFHRLPDIGTRIRIGVGDLSRDGHADLILVEKSGQQPGIHWLTNPGPKDAHRSVAWLHTMIGPTSVHYTSLALGDFGKDGLIDVAATTNTGSIQIFVQHRDSPPGWKKLPLPNHAEAPLGADAIIADINGDGRTDIVHVVVTGEMAPGASLVWYKQSVAPKADLDRAAHIS